MPVATRKVRRWTEKAKEALEDYFDCTDWDAHSAVSFMGRTSTT